VPGCAVGTRPERQLDDRGAGLPGAQRRAGLGLAAHDRERDRAVRRRDDDASEPADGLSVEDQLRVAGDRSRQPQAAQAAVRLALVIEARDGLLADVAALLERDRALVEAGLLRDRRVVQVDAVARAAALDAQRLDRVLGDR